MNAEDELKRMKTRQKEGLDAAKKNNKKFGRPKIQKPDNFDEVYRLWKDKKITAVSAMKKLNLKKNTFYKLVKENEVDG